MISQGQVGYVLVAVYVNILCMFTSPIDDWDITFLVAGVETFSMVAGSFYDLSKITPIKIEIGLLKNSDHWSCM